jgi:two-component system CheB/CheR fusion protein
MGSSKNQHQLPPPIVCVGASAGGLEAIERFFQSCPNDLGASYVVIQHLSSHYKSMMDDLINRYSNMKVKIIKTGDIPLKNQIYLIEAGTVIRLINGAFHVDKKIEGELTLPIDIFLQSLADDKRGQSTAVILSGTGCDGSRGVVALNAVGGFVIVQSPAQSGFDGMPKSAISTGVVDSVLGAEAIPLQIKKYLSADFIRSSSKESFFPELAVENPQEHYARIIDKLYVEFGINFALYKDATVIRRIERRMQVKHITDYKKYAEVIEKDPTEALSLRKELLIPVTNFFRDPEIFNTIKSQVIENLIDSHCGSGDIRVWVAGCATGEEAYSYAMLLESALRKRKSQLNFKVFATDVNPSIIDIASKGIYPESIKREVHKDIAELYFVAHDGQLKVNQNIRQRVVFAVHNLLTDAPFTKMNLVSCRNTLIYFKNDAQKEALKKLAFSVQPNGFLVLGKSESLIAYDDYFEVTDRKHKIFKCTKRAPASLSSGYIQHHKHNVTTSADYSIATKQNSEIELIADAQIKKCFIPLTLLVDHSQEVIHIYGEDTSLLELKPGSVNYQLANLLPGKIASVAVALLYRLNKKGGVITSDTVKWKDENTQLHDIQIKGWMIHHGDMPSHYVLAIVKIAQPSDAKSETSHSELNQSALDKITQLQLELTATRESLQSTIEEFETTNEELQATNEELMASNEELQGSNEELQSVNEDLNAVNAEYHEKVSILNRINADLDAMSLSTGIATIFIDDALRLTRFTPDASLIFKVRDQDLGRPLDEIVNTLNYDSFFEDINETLTTETTKEVEVINNVGQGYLMRIVKYRIPSSEKLGVAISLIESYGYRTNQKIIDALPHHIVVLDKQGDIQMVNEAWKKFVRTNQHDAIQRNSWLGQRYTDYCDHELSLDINSVLNGECARLKKVYPCHSSNEKRWFVMEVQALDHDGYSAVISHTNITDFKERQ